MKAIKDFMRELFDARIAEERTILANRAPYREKFFVADCLWDSRRFTLEMIESEKIVSIDDSDAQPVVITEYACSVSPLSRRRYSLRSESNSFLISSVEAECPLCHGHGDENCVACKGKKWI